ncbi:MAG: hypothetical protein IKQ33_03775 [Clostridia bacterium]|nr:hypothetical protein [Clostridia bacterium]
MAKTKNKNDQKDVVAQMIINLNDDYTVELECTPNFDLSVRINVLTQVLEHQVRLAESLNRFDDNRNLPS